MGTSDFLCDFCGRSWDGTFAMVEGHKGSLICDRCLRVAYAEVMSARGGGEQGGYSCVLCLEERDQVGWASPVREGVVGCKRCINQAATKLEKDPDWAWERPVV